MMYLFFGMAAIILILTFTGEAGEEDISLGTKIFMLGMQAGMIGFVLTR